MIWAGCRTAALPNDSGKPYGHYIDGHDKMRAVFRDNGKALTPEVEASIKAIPEAIAMWRISDCADYRQHQGKHVLKDVVVGLGIEAEKHFQTRFMLEVTQDLYPSLGEVPTGHSRVRFSEFLVTHHLLSSSKCSLFLVPKIHPPNWRMDFCTEKLSLKWCSWAFLQTRNSEIKSEQISLTPHRAARSPSSARGTSTSCSRAT